MNAIHSIMSGSANTILPMVTIGTIKSRREGEIVLVYLNDDEGDSLVVRYDHLSGPDRLRIRVVAQDPLSVLDRASAHSH